MKPTSLSNIDKKNAIRYHDCRLVILFVGLFILFFSFRLIVSFVFKTSLLAEWVQVGHNQWQLLTGLENVVYYSYFRIALFFFEVFFGWLAAALFCADKAAEEDFNDFYIVLWTTFLIGIPIVINMVPNLWIWSGYVLLMLISGIYVGKRIGFICPFKIRFLWQGLIEESTNLKVDTGRYGRYSFKGKNALWFIGFVILGLFILTVALFVATRVNM